MKAFDPNLWRMAVARRRDVGLRDYSQVEDEDSQRLLLFHAGDGEDATIRPQAGFIYERFG